MPKQSKKKGKAFIKPAGQSINNKWEVNDVTSEYGKSDENDASDMENVQGMISSHHICESINNTNFFNDKFKVSCFLSNGVSNALYLQIKENSPFTDTEWTTYLDISIKTLQRYIKDETHIFKSAHSEKIIELLEVMIFGNTVFDTTEQFYLWLKTPNYALGNTKPIELIKNSYGKELVMEALNRIEYGIFV